MKVYDIDSEEVEIIDDKEKPESEALTLTDEKALEAVKGAAYAAAVSDPKVQKRAVDSAKQRIDSQSRKESNQARESSETSNLETDKKITSKKIEADDIHYERHKVVLQRWGIFKVIPKEIAIIFEIFGYTLQVLYALTIGWFIYLAKFISEHFTGLSKGVWRVIIVTITLIILGLVIWGGVELFQFIMELKL